jgi:hypothetical protein
MLSVARPRIMFDLEMELGTISLIFSIFSLTGNRQKIASVAGTVSSIIRRTLFFYLIEATNSGS